MSGTMAASKRSARSPFGHIWWPTRAEVPEWDLVAASVSTNSSATMRTSPFSPPTPLVLRSGRTSHASRSASATAPIRVLIGDSDPRFRRDLRASLAADPSFDVVGEVDDGDLALQLLRRLRPDVALIDEDMPSFGGAAIARILRSELPETRVVVMTRQQFGGRR